jgi:hypothetical protein
MQRLNSHPWTSVVREDAAGNGYSTITWEWSGQQPAVIDDTKRGRITFYWVDEDVIPLDDSVVETVTVYTLIHHFSLLEWLGQPEGGSAAYRPDGRLGYSVLYHIDGGMLNLYIEASCPFSLLDYWNAETRITLSIGRSTVGFVHPAELVRMC